MTVANDLTSIWIEKGQREDAFTVRATLEDATNTIDQCHQRVQEIVDSGSFNTIPDELKQALNQWWIIIKTARTSIAQNPDIMAAFNWRP